jgi:hypothetical protein
MDTDCLRQKISLPLLGIRVYPWCYLIEQDCDKR